MAAHLGTQTSDHRTGKVRGKCLISGCTGRWI